MPSGVVVRIEHLSKEYRYGGISHETLRKDIQRWWATARGKEDPNAPLQDVYTERYGSKGDRFWALKDVSFDVSKGEVVGLIGSNGAGKSTLLKILSRVTSPTKGEIKVKGRIASLLEVGTGFHPELTGGENIFLNGAILGMTKDEITRKFDQIVAFAEIEDFVDTPVKRYSSGMYVRLAFAVAAHLDPEILVVDEVLAVGDAAFQKKSLGKMGDVAKAGRAILFVSHNMAAIQKLCSRAIWLEKGEIRQMGTASEVVRAYLHSIPTESDLNQNLTSGFLFFKQPKDIQEDYAITGIQLLDEAERPIKRLCTWDSVRLRIHYFARRPLKQGSVEFKIQTQEEVCLLRCSTEPDSSHPIRIVPGESYADCIFPAWPLAAGEFSMGAGLAIPRIQFVCWKENLCTIRVEEQDVFQSGLPPVSDRYLLAIDHHWELPQEIPAQNEKFNAVK